MLPHHREHIDYEQRQHNRQNGAESEIELSADRHDLRLHCMPIDTFSPTGEAPCRLVEIEFDNFAGFFGS